MVQPTTEVARVIGAVAEGDLAQHMSVEIDGRRLKGEFLRIGKVVNTMVDQLGSFASEVTRVAREVGTEGKLGGQARVKGVAGTWKDLTDNVNLMAANLTGQVRNIAEVTTAVARGDLSKKITVDVKGEILELKNTINVMVDQLNGFAWEVTRVAREVGTEGKLGGQAEVPGVAGTWADLTDNVNLMAANLTGQVRNIAEVTTAVARGDLSKKITVEVRGEILELKDTINTMVDQLNSFASEVTRVAREVGTEGRLGGQAKVEGVGGTWKDLTDNVNELAANFTGQVRNIAEVTTAVALGDLSKKITVDVKGEILELKDTINTMVDQLNSFASEVTRVAREVGSEGKLGGQAKVEGVAGTWADLTNNVNELAANLTGQVRNIAEVTTAVASGDLSKKITVDVKGEILELKNTVNTMVDQLNSFAGEVTRVAREVGTEGKLGGQAQVKGVGGTWKDLTDNVNLMAENLTGQVRNIAEVTTAVARGDLSKKIAVDVKGEILELKNTINVMVDQLNGFAVGGDPRCPRGRHRRQARRPGRGAGRRRHLEGFDRQRQSDGDQPNQPGARHRRRRHRGRAGQSQAQADVRRQGRDRGARRNHQRHDRDAVDLRRPGHQHGARGRRRGPAWRPGAGAGRRRPVARLDRQRQSARCQPDQPGALDRRRRDRGDQGRFDPLDRGRGVGRDGRAQGHDQRDDPQPQGPDAQERRAGLAQDQPRPLQPDAPGRARPVDDFESDHVRARAAGERAIWRLLRRQCRRRANRAILDLRRELWRGQQRQDQVAVQASRRADRAGGRRQARRCGSTMCRATISGSARALAQAARRTSTSCRLCSKTRSRR